MRQCSLDGLIEVLVSVAAHEVAQTAASAGLIASMHTNNTAIILENFITDGL